MFIHIHIYIYIFSISYFRDYLYNFKWLFKKVKNNLTFWSFSWTMKETWYYLGCHNRIPHAGWLKQHKFYFLLVLEAGSPRSGWQGWLLLRTVFTACRWLTSYHILTRLFFWARGRQRSLGLLHFSWGHQSCGIGAHSHDLI